MNKVLVVIVGPTASGKTSLGIKLAKRFNGEIISADSRAIYKSIDIASAKPSLKERSGVPHWGFDLVDPGQRFTAADFKNYTYQKISEIQSRGKLPFLVGGTGLYIDSVLYDYQFGGEVDSKFRAELASKTIEELIQYHQDIGIDLPENYKNKRYLIRSIEKHQSSDSSDSSKNNNKYTKIVVGITTDREILRQRIDQRNKQLLDMGIIEEAIDVSKKYGWSSESMTANAYPLVKKFLDGEISREDLLKKMNTIDWRLAKRQLTFMKRNKDIKWLSLNDAEQYISTQLKQLIESELII